MTSTLALPSIGSRNNQSGKNRFNWRIAPVLILFHVGAVAALFFFSWHAFFVAIFLYWVTGGLGLGMCYHRLLTHRSYATPKWFEYFLTICGATALEGGPLLWVAIHRKHHQFADKEGDPHSPRDGKWWAHAGWILTGNALRQDVATLKRYVPDLAEDKFHVWLTKYHLAPMAILASCAVRYRWLSLGAVGHFLSHRRGTACDVDRQLGRAYLGVAPLRDPRYVNQQLVGRAGEFRRWVA